MTTTTKTTHLMARYPGPPRWDGTRENIHSFTSCTCAVALTSLLILCCVYHSSDLQYFSTGQTTPKNCTLPWGIWTPSNTWFLEPTQVYPQIRISIGSAVFAGLTTDRYTDRPHYSICSNRPHLAIAVRRPNKKDNYVLLAPIPDI